MAAPVIRTPRGMIMRYPDGKARLVWSAKFQPKWQKQYSNAQEHVDSEVLRLSEPYTPMLSGMLIKSGDLGTVVGSGTVSWIAPYARARYYSPKKPGSATGPLRGPYWFERMKVVHGQAILAGARKIAGKGK